MNILIVTPFFRDQKQIGGVSTTVAMLSREFTKKGHNVILLVPGQTNRLLPMDSTEKTPVYGLCLRVPFNRKFLLRGFVSFCLFFPLNLFEIYRFTAKKQIQVVHLQYPLPWAFCFAVLRKICPWKLVVTLQGSDVHDLQTVGWDHRLLVKWLLKAADCVVAVSQSLLDKIRITFPGLVLNNYTVPNGAPIDSPSVDEQPVSLSEGWPSEYILTVGQIIHRKGMDILIKAMKLARARGVVLNLVIVGEGSEQSNLSTLARALGLSENIYFAGNQPHERALKIIQECLFFVLSSRAEGLPLVIAEAMASNKAVVATKVDGVPEIVQDGSTGLLVEPEDPQSLAEALVKLHNDRELRETLARRGRELAVRKYAWEVIAAQYLNIFSSFPGVEGGPSTSKKESPPLVPEIGVLALVPDEWDVSWQPRHHVLTRLSSYFHVVWVNPAPEWRDMIGAWVKSMGRQTAEIAGAPGFVVYRSRFFPKLYRPKWLANLIYRQRLKRVWRLLRLRGCKKIILYLWRPEFEKAIKLIPFDESCYHIDDEYSFSEVEVPPDPLEMRLIAAVDQVFIHSRGLLEKKGAINPRTVFVPNGCDYLAYSRPAAEPADLAGIPHPRVGYTGRIKRQLDWPLLLQLTSQHPEWSFVFVGPVTEDPEVKYAVRQLSERPNVYFLGYKPILQLAAYPQHFDVCVMPYRINDYTKYIYPLKLHEYLASGCPAVGSAVLSLQEFSHVVRLARSPDEWSQAIRDCLAPAACAPARIEERRSIARKYDWNRLVGLIARALCERLGSDCLEKIEKAAMGSSPATFFSTSTMTAHGAQPAVDNTAPELSRYPGSHPIG